MFRRPVRSVVLVAAVVCAAMAGCSGGSGGGDDAPKVSAAVDVPEGATAEAGTVRFCTSVPYEPFEYEANGELAGFDVDVAGALAAALGVEHTVSVVPYADVATGTALEGEGCDALIAAIPAAIDRTTTHRFSDPYFVNDQVVVASAESDPVSLESLDGVTVGVQMGSNGETAMRDQFPDADIIPAESVEALVASFDAGDSAVMVGDRGVLLNAVKDRDDVRVIRALPETAEELSVAVSPYNEGLAAAVSKAVAHAAAEGALPTLQEKWFGVRHSEGQ